MTGTGRCRRPSSAPGQPLLRGAPSPPTAHCLQPHPLLDAGPPPAAPRVCSRTGMGRKEEPTRPPSPAPGRRPRKGRTELVATALGTRPFVAGAAPQRGAGRSGQRHCLTCRGRVARGVALGLNGLGGGSVRITANKDRDQAQVTGDLTGPRQTPPYKTQWLGAAVSHCGMQTVFPAYW